MQRITLVFPSLKELWEFQKVARSNNYELVFNERKLIGEFSNEMIAMAITNWNATLQKTHGVETPGMFRSNSK